MSQDRKVVVVTGASQGLGAGVAQGFRDYRVVVNSRSITSSSGDPDLLAIAGDIGDPATGKRLVEAALAKSGRIDTLVKNAGLFIGGAFTAITEAEYHAILSTNLDGFFNVTQPVVAAMERQCSGHVVQITTTLEERAMAAFPSVLASLTKGGLNAATRSLAIEYAGRGIA